jgi:hypothetical protein
MDRDNNRYFSDCMSYLAEMKNAYKTLAGKLEGKRSLG